MLQHRAQAGGMRRTAASTEEGGGDGVGAQGMSENTHFHSVISIMQQVLLCALLLSSLKEKKITYVFISCRRSCRLKGSGAPCYDKE